jgi:hypothetical protein
MKREATQDSPFWSTLWFFLSARDPLDLRKIIKANKRVNTSRTKR